MGMMRIAKRVTVQDPDSQQTLVVIPAEIAAGVGPRDEAEWWEKGRDILRMTFVGPKDLPQGKRYKLVRHHGSLQISLPRFWLHDHNLKAGDTVEVFLDDAEPRSVYFHYTRQKRTE